MKFLSILISTLVLASCASSPIEYGESHYKYVTTLVSWAEAKILAENEGGRLATFATWEEFSNVQSTLPAGMIFWIGLSDAREEGSWMWIDGTPLPGEMLSNLELGRTSGARNYAHTTLQGALGSRENSGVLPRGFSGRNQVDGYLVELAQKPVESIESVKFVESVEPVADDWDERIELVIEQIQNSTEQHSPILIQQLIAKVENVFQKNTLNRFSVEYGIDGQRELGAEIFYGNGELFVLSHGGFLSGEKINLVTQGDYVFEWESGASTGIKIEKNENDIVDFILYMTDPAGFMYAHYEKYINQPETADVVEIEGVPWQEIVFKEPWRGYESMLVDTDSVWFHGIRRTIPDSGVVYSWYISRPTAYEALPESLEAMMEGVQFIEIEQTLGRHMTYL